MSVSTDYSNRTVDMFIFYGAAPTGDQLISPGFGEGSGKQTTGIQKLMQRWAILFLTEQGTMEYHLDLGTRFLTLASQGGLRDLETVRSEFRLGARRVENTLAELETDDMPADERLQSADLASAVLDKAAGKLRMTVNITSEAGTDRDIILPVPVPIQ
jgi:hypothetical protein